MQKFWDTLVWLWVHYSPWLLASFLPSVIAGLMISPKTQKAAGIVQKILDVLRKLVGFFSVLTHKDEPGTFKLPFYLGKLAAKKVEPSDTGPNVKGEVDPDGKPVPPKPPLVPPAASLLLVLALSIPQSGCCKVFGLCGDTKQDLIDCTAQAGMANAPHLLPIIKDILTGKSEGWTQRIWDLIKEFGRDAVACAMQQVGQDLLMSVPAGGGEPTPDQAAALEGVRRAREFAAGQKWQFKSAEK